MWNVLYAVWLALPRILLRPTREFQVVIPESGRPFVRDKPRDIAAEIGKMRKSVESLQTEFSGLRLAVHETAESLLSLSLERLELAELKVLKLAELEALELAELEKLNLPESERLKRGIDEFATADLVAEIRRLRQVKAQPRASIVTIKELHVKTRIKRPEEACHPPVKEEEQDKRRDEP
jgi:hypothetical protein